MDKVSETVHQDIPPELDREKAKSGDLDLQVINIREMKKRQKEKSYPEEEKGEFAGFGYWLLFGSLVGVAFVLLALIEFRFIYLAPLPPIGGILAWFVKRLINKFKLEDILK